MASKLFDLSGKNVLITGASRGIGQAVAIGLAEAGAAVCLAIRPGSSNNATIDALKALPAPSHNVAHATIECDMSNLDDVRSLFDRALALMSNDIHILVNCAGIQRRAPAVNFTDEDWDAVITTNLSASWVLARAAGRHMVPLKRGKIINFGSLLTFQGGITVPAYAASKGGVAQLTKALSNEWASSNVQVNCVCPGYIETDMNERIIADPTRLRQISERIPAGRWGKPEDFVGPVVFLASAASSYVTGENMVVDGGWMGR
ncbi:NAD(P)-binding protein [Clavulina sp. PMI_390]|nr:NAD(P)-binding protein [Clavulina sp. PMI_390]